MVSFGMERIISNLGIQENSVEKSMFCKTGGVLYSLLCRLDDTRFTESDIFENKYRAH